jgi:hypothetical protein
VRPLTFFQKFSILAVNLLDSLLLGYEIFIAASSESYTSIPYFLCGLNGMRLLMGGYSYKNITMKMGN